MIKKMVLFVGALSVCTGAAFAEEKGKLSDPVEILKRADAASKAIKVAQYEAKAYSLNADGEAQLIADGKAIIEGFAGGGPEKFIISGSFGRPGSEEKHTFSTGTDGEDYYMIDANTKKAYVDMDSAVVGSNGNLARQILMLEYVHGTPFTDELNSLKKKLVGTTKIGSEECYEVAVNYTGAGQTAHWFFSTKDFLPRRVDRLFTQGGQPTRGSRLVVTSLKADPKLETNPFKFKLPAGFEQIDDFAP